MIIHTVFNSEIGRLFIVSDHDKITHLFIEGQKHFDRKVIENSIKDSSNQVLQTAVEWLQAYFSGERISPLNLPICPQGSDFQKHVWNILLKIPYGETITYGDIAKKLEKSTGKTKISAQAVGGAVSRNPVSIIIPCHRVVGKKGLVGYDGGLDKKIFLLNLERNSKKV